MIWSINSDSETVQCKTRLREAAHCNEGRFICTYLRHISAAEQYNRETNSKQVPRGKVEKDFDEKGQKFLKPFERKTDGTQKRLRSLLIRERVEVVYRLMSERMLSVALHSCRDLGRPVRSSLKSLRIRFNYSFVGVVNDSAVLSEEGNSSRPDAVLRWLCE